MMKLALKPVSDANLKKLNPILSSSSLSFESAEKPKMFLSAYQGPSAADTKMYDQRTHVYMRPDMYIGSDVPTERQTWLYNLETGKLYKDNIDLVPGLERIFMEILSNASDNACMSRRKGIDPGKIDVVMTNSMISITNYGAPMPVEIHPDLINEQIYVPEISFGRLLTSRHYETDRHEAGTNGVGSKATNIYSKKFMATICDAVRHLKYTQLWTENMINCHRPNIEPYNGKVSSVQVSYEADFARFGYEVPNGEQGGYTKEAFYLFARHTLDVSLNAKIPVIFNGISFNLSNIKEYGRLFFGDIVDDGVIHYQWPPGTEIIKKKKGIQVSKDPGILPEIELLALDTPDEGCHISFTNGIQNFDGGVHTDAAFKAVGDSTVKMINETILKKLTKGKKDKELDAKEKRANTINISNVKPHISIILSAKLVNPKFTSQEKTKLTTPIPKIHIDESELKAIAKWELVDRLYADIEAKQYNNITKNDGRSRGRVKTKNGIDANQAGKADKHKCTLYITEGNSGLGYANKLITLTPGGRDFIGTLPLRGKCINSMKSTLMQVDQNAEFTALRKMLGLKYNTDYTIEVNYNTLRYGRLMVMADADVDGKHIAGLILLYFHVYFPSLLAINFAVDYITPIISVTSGKNILKFYTEVSYNKWKDMTPGYEKWKHKYYKGLGSSKEADVKSNYADPHIINWFYDIDSPEAFSLVFQKKRENDRKQWIEKWTPLQEEFNDLHQPISWYLNNEVILHSLDNIQRTIPRLLDGLKESQRKIIYAAHLKWKIGSKKTQYNEVKLAQLGAFVAEKSSYHHGEKIIGDTIVGMTQDFIGSNNIAYFTKGGMLGTRYMLGDDAAETRYTYTQPMPLLSYIYKKKDAPILKHLQDEGMEIEPEEYLPVIPMILANGCCGIATGYSSYVPSHNPLDLVKWLKLRLQDSDNLPTLNPWYRGFTGTIEVYDRSKKDKKIVLKPSDETVEEQPVSENELQQKEREDEEEQEEEIPEEFEDEQDFNREPDRQLLSMRIYGKFEVRNNGDIVITELPIGRSPYKYHKWLEGLEDAKKIKGFRDLSGDDIVYFEIYGYVGTPTYKTLRLQRNAGMSNMVLLNEYNKPVRYDNANDIIEKFYELRLPYYQKRKDYIISNLTQEITKMNHQMRFIQAVVNKEIVVVNTEEEEIYQKMDLLGIPHEIYNGNQTRSLNKNKISILQKSIEEKENERKIIYETNIKQMMLTELEEFEDAYRKEYKIKDETVKLNVNGKKKVGNTVVSTPVTVSFPKSGVTAKRIQTPTGSKYNVPKTLPKTKESLSNTVPSRTLNLKINK